MDVSRQALVDAAERRFAEAGRAGVGPRDLVKRLGLPPETVFRHFKTRDALFSAVLGQVQRELFTFIETHCPVVAGESALSMIRRLAETYSLFLEERSEPFLEILRGSAEPAGAATESDLELARLTGRIAKQFEVLLLLGHLDGSVGAEAAGDTARRILNVVLGTVRLNLTRPTARTRNLHMMLTSLVGCPASVRAA